VPPWVVAEAKGDQKRWFYRQILWTNAKRRRERWEIRKDDG